MATQPAKPRPAVDPPVTYRFLRYLAPNAVTCASLVFGMVSMAAAHRGAWDLAGWMIIYAVLTDRLDGMVARMVKGTSDFGVQLDSFADFCNFGIAPAFLIHTFFESHPQLDLDHGWRGAMVTVACIAWVFGAVFRLARFNVAAEDGVPTKIFFGVPTTLAGGLLIVWFLALLKYAGADLGVPGGFGGAKLVGDGFETPRWVWTLFPIGMLVGAFLMASSLRMLKVGTTARKATTIFVVVNVMIGYALGFARMFPEWLVIPPTMWILVFLVWGQLSPYARTFQPPPLFPRKDEGKLRMRPQEDLALDEDE